jgi:hypothetical protein
MSNTFRVLMELQEQELQLAWSDCICRYELTPQVSQEIVEPRELLGAFLFCFGMCALENLVAAKQRLQHALGYESLHQTHGLLVGDYMTFATLISSFANRVSVFLHLSCRSLSCFFFCTYQQTILNIQFASR